ncbi:hypothetical protein DL96DRAFT_1672399 [Flagelloscypha sp. PMI_526]|nr:hypothetical protein DL96DRAFT_1672399 [Flagelloscypha sp. PMI_526]
MADTLVFQALHLANEHRTAYGLRYNDLQRYRKHCANRTHRLRSKEKMTHGKGRDFKKHAPLQTENIREGHLQLYLFEAERAWAYSQELLANSTLPANSERASTLRHSATGRFRRSVHWATQLLSHCQSLFNAGRLSPNSLIQVSCYVLILNGRFLRYREDFEDALTQLSVARSLLDELASAAVTSRDQALATVFADEIGPEIRHCAHELGHTKAYDIDGIVADLAPKHRNQLVEGAAALIKRLHSESGKGESRKQLKELSWEGQPVPVRNPELVDALLRVQEAETRLESSKQSKSSKKAVAAYDAVLLALSDASDLAKKIADTQPSTASSRTPGARDGHFIHAFLVYQLLSRRIQRDLLMVESIVSESSKVDKSSKSASSEIDPRVYPGLVKLLDTVIQSLNQMRTLSIIDDSPDFSSSIDARISYTKARRCLYLARCYAASQVKKYAEALVLIQHANIHIRETQTSLKLVEEDPINTSASPFYSLTTSDAAALDESLAADALTFKRDWYAFNSGSINPEDHKTYKKPTFFNIALNYVELDMDALNERAGKESSSQPVVQQQEKKNLLDEEVKEDAVEDTPQEVKPSRTGLGSLLGGWWGRS